MAWRVKRSKHRGKRVQYEGQWFDSQEELCRFLDLRRLEDGGLIKSLTAHVRFPLVVNGYKVGTYTPDFRYLDRQQDQSGVWTIEEWKPSDKRAMSRDAIPRMRLFRALYSQYRYLVSTNRAVAVEFDQWVKRGR